MAFTVVVQTIKTILKLGTLGNILVTENSIIENDREKFTPF